MSDSDLARAASQGAAEAFEELYKRHRRLVYAICFKMLRDADFAEDITQEVFCQLCDKIGSFRGEADFKTWLHRVTVNEVLMHFRKAPVKFEKNLFIALEELYEKGGYAFDRPVPPEHIVDRIALKDAIAKLPRGYKRIFILHDIEGYEHEEAARLLGCTAGTCKSQLHKARLKLQKLLNKKANPRLLTLRPAY